MKSESILIKLVAALETLPDKDLRRLSAILAQPGAGKILCQIIDSTIELREAERKNENDQRKQTGQGAKPDSSAITGELESVPSDRYGINPYKDIHEAFIALLEDRSLFPSTRDVVEGLNSTFNWEINYEDFRKRGRRDLIQKYIKRLNILPKSEQIRKLELLYDRTARGSRQRDQYRQLFKLLTDRD